MLSYICLRLTNLIKADESLLSSSSSFLMPTKRDTINLCLRLFDKIQLSKMDYKNLAMVIFMDMPAEMTRSTVSEALNGMWGYLNKWQDLIDIGQLRSDDPVESELDIKTLHAMFFILIDTRQKMNNNLFEEEAFGLRNIFSDYRVQI